jgi:hypothetical protein
VAQDIFNYEFLTLVPDQLSENNPVKYQISGSTQSAIVFVYTYSTEGSYPVRSEKYYNGNPNGYIYNFVYENCE